MNSSRRGRRPGNPATKDQILQFARRRFAESGYAGTTLRSIAAEAKVDVALISYYFGSKKGLLGATLALSITPAEVLGHALDGDPAVFVPGLLGALVDLWDSPVTGPQLKALLAATAHNESTAAIAAHLMEREMIEVLAARLRGRNARVRAAAFFALIAGVLVSRYLLRAEPLASLTRDELVRALSPALTQTLREPNRLIAHHS